MHFEKVGTAKVFLDGDFLFKDLVQFFLEYHKHFKDIVASLRTSVASSMGTFNQYNYISTLFMHGTNTHHFKNESISKIM